MTHLSLKDNQNGLQTWQVTIDCPADDALYADYFHVASDHDKLRIIEWDHDGTSIEHYDAQFKETKRIITDPITLAIQTECDTLPELCHLHVSYYRRSDNKISHELLTITNSQPSKVSHVADQTEQHTTQREIEPKDYVLWQHTLPIPMHIAFGTITATLFSGCVIALWRKKSFLTILLTASMIFMFMQTIKFTLIHGEQLYEKIYINRTLPE